MSSQLTQQQDDSANDLASAFGEMKTQYELIKDEVPRIQQSLGSLEGAQRDQARKAAVANSQQSEEIKYFNALFFNFQSISAGSQDEDDAEFVLECVERHLFIENPYLGLLYRQPGRAIKNLKTILRHERSAASSLPGGRSEPDKEQISKIVDYINHRPRRWKRSLNARKAFWQQLTSTQPNLFVKLRWHDLMDRVVFAFPELHGQESLALTAFRKYAFHHENMNGQSFAENMTPTPVTYDSKSLKLTVKLPDSEPDKLIVEPPTAQVTWPDIHKALDQVVKQLSGKKIKYAHVIIAVVGPNFFSNRKLLKKATNTLYKHVQIRRSKLRNWFACPMPVKDRGLTKCNLGWVPRARELVTYAAEATERHLTHQDFPVAHETPSDSDCGFFSPCNQFVAELCKTERHVVVRIRAKASSTSSNTSIDQFNHQQIRLFGASASLELENGKAVARLNIAELSEGENVANGLCVGEQAWEPERESEV